MTPCGTTQTAGVPRISCGLARAQVRIIRAGNTWTQRLFQVRLGASCTARWMPNTRDMLPKAILALSSKPVRWDWW